MPCLYLDEDASNPYSTGLVPLKGTEPKSNISCSTAKLELPSETLSVESSIYASESVFRDLDLERRPFFFFVPSFWGESSTAVDWIWSQAQHEEWIYSNAHEGSWLLLCDGHLAPLSLWPSLSLPRPRFFAKYAPTSLVLVGFHRRPLPMHLCPPPRPSQKRKK